MHDPIAELIEDLVREGRPSLAWMVVWSQNNKDPLLAAWRASRDPAAMMRLLTVHPGYDIARSTVLGWFNIEAVAVFRLGRWPRVHLTERGPVDYDRIAAAIRRVVPAPPSLEELLRVSARA